MSVDIKAILDLARIEYRSRGKNVGRNRIATHCPWCGSSDHSGHLSISLETEAYYCFRNTQHRGRSFIRLLTEYGVAYREAVVLYNSKVTGGSRPKPEPREVKHRRQLLQEWGKFTTAVESDACLDYLYLRGWDDPEQLVYHYDLRHAKVGEWAMRVLIPLPYMHDVEGWTGRAIRKRLEPRYYTEDYSDGMIYQPRLARSTVFLFEGPLDALKLCSATEDDDCSAIALLGKNINAERRARIMTALSAGGMPARKLVLSMDRLGVGRAEHRHLYEQVRTIAPAGCTIIRATVPDQYKDAGDMPLAELRQWASDLAI